MKKSALFLVLTALISFFIWHTANTQPLSQLRYDHETNVFVKWRAGDAPVTPPGNDSLKLTSYPTPLGDMAAYISAPDDDEVRYPAIIWLIGGFGNGIDSYAWLPAPLDNDQSARIFRRMDIVTMYPSLRGGNNNPGYQETFYGEVDDVISAAEHLASLDHVDPSRIYLGGHSTGATLALLVAASTDKFRAVFAIGPVSDPANYGQDSLPYDIRDRTEVRLRAPIYWLGQIETPTFVFEGAEDPGNVYDLRELQRKSRNSLLQFYPVANHNHFSVLRPINTKIARKINGDYGDRLAISFSESELEKLR